MIGEQGPESFIKHEADLEQVAASVAFMRETFEVDDSYGADFLRDQLRVKLSGFVLAGAPRDVTATVSYPSSWWQHTKRELFKRPRTRLGKWLSAGFPYRITSISETETINRRICPHPFRELEKSHLEWLSGPEVYTNQIDELEQDLDHWKLRAQAFERRVDDQRQVLEKQAGVIRKLMGQERKP